MRPGQRTVWGHIGVTNRNRASQQWLCIRIALQLEIDETERVQSPCKLRIARIRLLCSQRKLVNIERTSKQRLGIGITLLQEIDASQHVERVANELTVSAMHPFLRRNLSLDQHLGFRILLLRDVDIPESSNRNFEKNVVRAEHPVFDADHPLVKLLGLSELSALVVEVGKSIECQQAGGVLAQHAPPARARADKTPPPLGTFAAR